MVNVLFRTDASSAMGTGHVMRCIALAQGLKNLDGTAIFLSKEMPDALKQRSEDDEGFAIHALDAAPGSDEDALETVIFAKANDAQWIVVDGYQFTGSFQKTLKAEGFHVLFIDDYGHADHYSADLVLNQNIYASEKYYPLKDPSTELLLGPRFALLRKEFTASDGDREMREDAQKILVTLGGGDPDNMTAKVLRSLALMENNSLDVTVIIGGANPHREDVEALADSSQFACEVLTNVTDMPRLMTTSDMAICTGGTTTLELLFLGVPFITGAFADNQVAVVEALEEKNLAVNVGWYQKVSEDTLAEAINALCKDTKKRQSFSASGLAFVDGKGAMRVCKKMMGALLTLRTAEAEDAKLLFEWANDSTVRESSFSSGPIPWEDHEKWYADKLDDPECHIFIGMDSHDQPIGQVRFSCEGDRAMISISIDSEMRGKGYGRTLIDFGSRRLFAFAPSINYIDAYIKPKNEASISLFLKAGFSAVAPTEISGQPALHYTLKKDTIEL